MSIATQVPVCFILQVVMFYFYIHGVNKNEWMNQAFYDVIAMTKCLQIKNLSIAVMILNRRYVKFEAVSTEKGNIRGNALCPLERDLNKPLRQPYPVKE